jgi:hypothetical protein
VPLNASTKLNFTITNPNAATDLAGVAFTDALPSGLEVSTPNGLTGSCGGGIITAAPGSTVISLSGATLTAGTTCIFSVNVTGLVAGTQSNSVTVNSTNGSTGNTSMATVTVVAPPTLTKAFIATPVTFTEKAHDAPAARVAPDRLMLFDPGMAVIVPPPHEPIRPLGVDTISPDGKVSVNASPVNAIA